MKTFEIIYKYGPYPDQIFASLSFGKDEEEARKNFTLGYPILMMGELGDQDYHREVHMFYKDLISIEMRKNWKDTPDRRSILQRIFG